MADTNPQYETAKRCRKCDAPGLKVSSSRQRRERRGMCTMEVYKCENVRCKWYDVTWLVQLNDDGTIPERKKSNNPKDKEFPNAPRMIQMGQGYMDLLKAEEERGETLGGL